MGRAASSGCREAGRPLRGGRPSSAGEARNGAAAGSRRLVETAPLVDQTRKGETRMIEVSPEWWRTFFTGLMLDLWEAVPTADQDRSEADFLQKTLGVAPPAKLLDVPCGNGRLALELAARGY